MKTKAIFYLSFSQILCLSFSLLAADRSQIVNDVPQTWVAAASSWGMTIKEFKDEADKTLSKMNRLGKADVRYDQLVPVLNPYPAVINANIIASLKPGKTIVDYKRWVAEQVKKHPKFTVAR